MPVSAKRVLTTIAFLRTSLLYTATLANGFRAYCQGLSRDLETGCLKFILAIVKFLGILIFKGEYKIFRFQP